MMWPTEQRSQHHHVQGSIVELHVTSRTGLLQDDTYIKAHLDAAAAATYAEFVCRPL